MSPFTVFSSIVSSILNVLNKVCLQTLSVIKAYVVSQYLLLSGVIWSSFSYNDAAAMTRLSDGLQDNIALGLEFNN